MKALRSLVLLAAAAVVVGACGSQPRVTARSPAECEASLAAVSKSAMAAGDSAAYMGAILRVVGPVALRGIGSAFASAFSRLGDDDAPSVDPPAPDSTTLSTAACVALDGLTEKAIIAQSDSLGLRARAVLDSLIDRAYMARLDSVKARFQVARDSMRAFRVVSARLVQEVGFMGLEATFVLHVTNETAHTVSRAYFDAQAMTPGREVPWVKGTFNYRIPGGLAPGESGAWQLQPNMFQGDWTTVRVPASAELVVEPIRLDDAQGEPLWGGVTFTSGDQHLLDSLRARRPGPAGNSGD